MGVKLKAKELRIGNLILIDGEPCNIGYVVIEGLVMQEMKANLHFMYHCKFEAIPISEKWLKNLGFDCISKKRNWYDYNKEFNGFDFAINIEGKIAIGRNGNWQTLTFIKEIKYVHHLQNVFYDFTQIELIIKELTHG